MKDIGLYLWIGCAGKSTARPLFGFRYLERIKQITRKVEQGQTFTGSRLVSNKFLGPLFRAEYPGGFLGCIRFIISLEPYWRSVKARKQGPDAHGPTIVIARERCDLSVSGKERPSWFRSLDPIFCGSLRANWYPLPVIGNSMGLRPTVVLYPGGSPTHMFYFR